MQKPSRVIRRKIRILQSEIQMLQHYHSQILELHEDYKSEYARDLDEFVQRARQLLNEAPPPDPEPVQNSASDITIDDVKFRQEQEARSSAIPDNTPSSQKSDAPDWAKKLYKKIALMTHPDRISDETLRDTLRKSFMKANRALEDGKLDDLLGVAIELNVDAGLEDEALIPLLSAKIKSCREQIQQIEMTAEWVWGESLGMKQQRTALLGDLLRARGYDLTSEQVGQILSGADS